MAAVSPTSRHAAALVRGGRCGLDVDIIHLQYVSFFK
jgi:hypothetical protein